MKGSYNFKDHRGIHRQADYIADKAGFRAEVKMNEPGTANQNPADINIHSSVHPHFGNPAVHGGYSGYRHGHGIVFTGHDYGKHGYGKGPAAPGILGFAGAGHFGHGHIHGYGY